MASTEGEKEKGPGGTKEPKTPVSQRNLSQFERNAKRDSLAFLSIRDTEPMSPAVRGPLINKASAGKQPSGGKPQRESFRRSPSPRRRRGREPKRELHLESNPSVVVPRMSERFTVEEAKQVKGMVQDVCKGRSTISSKEFSLILDKLEASGFISVRNTPFHDRLFTLFDSQRTSKINTRELLAGLSLICKGTKEERLRLTFDLYDTDGSGSLDRTELIQGLKAAYVHALELSRREE
eukprot:CAMPEP_0119124734 /NCGR_PEP_ID=MMETSP1310-20130426/4269_1 /TAXON_ID=464262 /ORGANISM="Genus nov. species nov., Strain RCC2339" /LENGTH=236 /DNA_ID=CAMNT_0007114731 /DNA_START=75 /DNA_END=782 /DNA_ORIENTATION=+